MGNSCDCNENNELEIFCNDLERRLESNNTINSKILSSYQEISQTKKLEKMSNQIILFSDRKSCRELNSKASIN